VSTYLQILIICSANSLFNRVNPEPARHQLRFRRWQAGEALQGQDKRAVYASVMVPDEELSW